MKRIEFHDRKQETKEIIDILDAEPSLITFIYGPINSGKTALVTHLIDHLSEDYKVFYINLRGRFISNYDDFIKVLFDVEHVARYERIKEFLKPVAAVLPESYNGIPIPKDTFLKLFKEKEIEDVFVYIETVLRVFYESGRVPVLVIDELQVIGDMKIDGHLIYKLFNFFVRLTKELHLAHVFVVTSDSLFLEQVYSEAMLSGRREYLRVDDFGYEQTMAFLDGYGWGEQEKEIAWHNAGGKPVSLVKLINAKASGKNIEDVVSSMFTLRTGEIETRLKIVKELGDELVIGDKHFDVHHGKLVSVLEMFISRDEVGADEIDEISKRYLVKENILFADPLTKMIKPQSQLDLLAIRDVVA
ncbi:MAG TPA: ATP-binding protein [Methanosarcinales archaeon]|nr:ATP-binding protein [Methanosarcinales archaeon]